MLCPRSTAVQHIATPHRAGERCIALLALQKGPTLTTVRVSVQLQPQHGTLAKLRDAWLRAEEMGTDVLFTWDHFFPLSGDPDGLHYECLTLLTAMAESTSRPQIGAMVLANSYRNPNLVADMSRTIDHISGGRYILGIGAGWAERDYTEYGYDFGTAPDRLRALDAAMPVIKDRLTQLNPGPAGPMPILIGGSGPKVTLRIVAQHANIWNCFGDPDTAGGRSRQLDAWCERVGRDPSEIERSVLGVKGEGIDQADAYADQGLTHLITTTSGPDWDMSDLKRLIDWRDRRNG